MQKYLAVIVGIVIVALVGCYYFFSAYHIAITPVTQTPITNTTPTSTPPPQIGLVLQDKVIGSGAYTSAELTAIIEYTAKLLDTGTVVETSSTSTPYFINLSSSEPPLGLQKGLLGMRVGGTRVIIVPPELGYGAQGKGAIPPNASVVYEVKLVALLEKPHTTPPPEQ